MLTPTIKRVFFDMTAGTKRPPIGTLPVFAETGTGPHFLGWADYHSKAVALGVMSGIKCEMVSKSKLDGDERLFFVLH